MGDTDAAGTGDVPAAPTSSGRVGADPRRRPDKTRRHAHDADRPTTSVSPMRMGSYMAERPQT